MHALCQFKLSFTICGWLNRLKLKLFYAFTGGFYTYSIFALLFWETRRKDFGVSMSHHIATLFLILISYIARFSLRLLPHLY